MRIYHVGPPKTGTSSFQYAIGNNADYIGIKQPRTLHQNQAYHIITNHLRWGRGDIDTNTIPDHFIYSEEMILWSTYPGHLHEILVRLSTLLRPQDKVIVSTRDLTEVLFSWYCERFEDFHPMDFRNSALKHASFEAYNWSNLTSLLSRIDKSQIEVLDFRQLLAGKSKTLSERKISLERISNENNKHKGEVIQLNLNSPNVVRLLKYADTIYSNAFPSKNNRSRFSSSRIIQPLVPLKTFQIRRPSESELLEVIQGRFSTGLAYLKNEFGIDYNALQQP